MATISFYNQWQEVKNKKLYNWITIDLIGFQIDFDNKVGDCIITIIILGLSITIDFVFNEGIYNKFAKKIKKLLENL